jgi:transposase InsO family protein
LSEIADGKRQRNVAIVGSMTDAEESSAGDYRTRSDRATHRSDSANASPKPAFNPQSARSAAALAEAINGLYKTELIRPRKPRRTIEELELATAEWVDWFNHDRLYEYCGDIPPAELETAYYAQTWRPAAG